MPTDPKKYGNPSKASSAPIPGIANYFGGQAPSLPTIKELYGEQNIPGSALTNTVLKNASTSTKSSAKPKATTVPKRNSSKPQATEEPFDYWAAQRYRTPEAIERDVRDNTGIEPRIVRGGKRTIATDLFGDSRLVYPTGPLSPNMPKVRDVRAGLGIGLLAVPGLAAGVLAPEVLGVSGVAGILTGGAASAIEQLGQDKLLDFVDPKPKYFHPDGTPIPPPGSYAELKADQVAFRKKNPFAAEAMANIVQLPFTNVFTNSIKDRAASALIGGASTAGTGYVGRLLDGKPTTSDDFWGEVSKGSATGFMLPSSSGEGEGYQRQVHDGSEGPQSAQRIKPTARPTTELDTWRATDPTPAPTTESSYKIIPWRFTEPVPQQRVPAPKKATAIDKANSVIRSTGKDIQAANAALRTVHGMGEAPLDAKVGTQENIMPRDPQVRPLTIKTPQKSFLPIVRSSPRLPNPDARVAPGFREMLVAPQLPQKVTTPNTLSTRAGGWKEVGRSGTDPHAVVTIKNAQGKQETSALEHGTMPSPTRNAPRQPGHRPPGNRITAFLTKEQRWKY